MVAELTAKALAAECTWLDCMQTLVLCIPHPNDRFRIRPDDLRDSGHLGNSETRKQWRALIMVSLEFSIRF